MLNEAQSKWINLVFEVLRQNERPVSVEVPHQSEIYNFLKSRRIAWKSPDRFGFSGDTKTVILRLTEYSDTSDHVFAPPEKITIFDGGPAPGDTPSRSQRCATI